MYANKEVETQSGNVAKGSFGPGLSTCGGPAEWPTSKRPLVPGSPQYGDRMEHSAESTSEQELCSDNEQTDMAGLCPLSSGDCRCEGEPCEEEQLAPMGQPSSTSPRSLRPKRKTHLVKPRGPVSTTNVLALLKYQNYRCALTGRELTPKTAALDHIMPVNRGGEHVVENTQVLHKEVNRAKGSLSNREFIKLCREVLGWSDATNRKDSI